jgi:methyltransferase (TIGR00027 family)
MHPKQFSRTAWGVAVHRAAHQTLDCASIFPDPFAHQILGAGADEMIQSHSTMERRTLRLFLAVRSRFAEDALRMAVSRGVSQVVVLGAGLDTFALRNPFPQLRVFEVDHPATQEWKRACLARAKLSAPINLEFAPVDFETEKLENGLARAGFDRERSTFFIWLGVVPYLTRDAIVETLSFIAAIPDAEVVFDYSEPLESYPIERRAAVAALGGRAATLGEPWLSHFNPEDIAHLLHALNFDELEDLGPRQIAMRFYNQTDAPNVAGAHIIRASRKRNDRPEI